MKQTVRGKLAVVLAPVLALVALVALAAGVHGVARAQAMVRDNSSNSIIYGGAVTPQEFVSKAQANNPSDLQAIYSAYGLNPADYGNFQQNAKMGVASKNGDITVNGQVVAHNAVSLGRNPQPNSTPRAINGKQYYESRSQDVFVSPSIPVMAMFDNQGRFTMGVLTSCGNPIRGTPVAPTQSCDLLQRTPVPGQANTYSFTTKATAANGATVNHVVYDFGDGTAQVTRTRLDDAVVHTFAQPGTYQTKVTVYVDTPGGQIPVTSASCTSAVTVQAAQASAYRCNNLTASMPANGNGLQYTFTAMTSQQNAQLSYVNFDFGDGTTAGNVQPNGSTNGTTGTNTSSSSSTATSANSTSVTNGATGATTTTAGATTTNTGSSQVSVDHTYAQPGTYTVRATVFFTVPGQNSSSNLQSSTCTTQITTQQTTPMTTTSTPQAPKTLPATGAGAFAALFAGTSVVGSAGYYLYTKRRLGRMG